MDRAAKTGKVNVIIDTTSITTGSDAFNMHLQSAELFESAKYRTIKFSDNRITFAGDKTTTISSNLTLFGKAQPVTPKANLFNCYVNPMLRHEVCSGDFETALDRPSSACTSTLIGTFPKTIAQ